ncbi:FAD-binding oxidoreductase [Actinoplanes sp. N902-109]|uniref:FAD-binding oxidoreductase n=1 Tax=Actinoplanes sp. (strain N902-109) TaxID=649831 RepID=UPI00032948C5|nr:FAD-binding oxidoreductase [Actinoplanes sp. N902-109]AGL18150.1 Oxidoreductase FAD-binding domain-containing protein [Actinoplanes sp. N902-109]
MSWEKEDLEAVVGRPLPMIVRKQISALDEGCRVVLAHSPIAAFGYRDPGGVARTTFIGGRPGFARVLSPGRIAVPAPGPVEAGGAVSLFFLLPGVGEVLRVNGTAGAPATAATTIDITEAFVHCAQAVLRARLWQPPVPPPVPPAPQVTGGGPLSHPGIADFLAAAPFLALSSWDGAGGSDTSPRGDQGAAVRLLDGRTVLVPDRRGNKRADTLHNLLHDDRVSFAALVPGRSGVLHVRGRGSITDDPDLLAGLALRGVPPHLGIVIAVEHADLTAGDAVTGARLWNPAAHVDRGQVPDLLALGGEHLAANLAGSAGGPPGWLMKLIGAVPGLTRLLRLAMNRAYRSGLRKEGYADVTPVPARRSAPPAVVPDGSLRDVRVVEVRRETPAAMTLVLADGGTFDFHPGQFFTLGTEIDGRSVRRAYSASSAPGSARLELTVKHVEGGRFSAHVHRNLRVGDRLTVRGPSGSFHIGPQAPADLVLVAAGSGITPMLSMIRAWCAAPAAGRVCLLYSSRTAADIIFADALAELAEAHPGRLTVTHVLTSRDGRLTAAAVDHWLTAAAPAPAAEHYLCGPEALMDLVEQVILTRGTPAARIHRETYTRAPGPPAPPTIPRQLTVTSRGTATVEPGQTLLDAALAAGLPLPFSCTVGTCGDCIVRLCDGTVTPPDPALASTGTVRTCVSYPMSDITLDIAGTR